MNCAADLSRSGRPSRRAAKASPCVATTQTFPRVGSSRMERHAAARADGSPRSTRARACILRRVSLAASPCRGVVRVVAASTSSSASAPPPAESSLPLSKGAVRTCASRAPPGDGRTSLASAFQLLARTGLAWTSLHSSRRALLWFPWARASCVSHSMDTTKGGPSCSLTAAAAAWAEAVALAASLPLQRSMVASRRAKTCLRAAMRAREVTISSAFPTLVASSARRRSAATAASANASAPLCSPWL
mmetsp:Transcript_35772/g.69494  ORF Transcript_35772/g.69494 Transcript_35772/m.69494 type:complete len:247 (+) Transcript_35772:1076-1816(+)